ncbi:hypothetical protein OBV_00740 [Oscillibacter valericigenes Sjm18-20]|nr:hypothetical protein OBV_00740 [Oscillibacter valericigenes Sjm18-20]
MHIPPKGSKIKSYKRSFPPFGVTGAKNETPGFFTAAQKNAPLNRGRRGFYYENRVGQRPRRV